MRTFWWCTYMLAIVMVESVEILEKLKIYKCKVAQNIILTDHIELQLKLKNSCDASIYQVRSPRKARSPSAMVLVSGSVTIFPATFDRAASSAPFGSAAKIQIEGLIAFAANVTPEINPPPVLKIKKKKNQ